MNEAEWLASKDPVAMMRVIVGAAVVNGESINLVSDRKLRLFACTCCRMLWGFLDERDRRAVALAERWADGEDTHSELYDLISGSAGMVRALHWADAVAVAGAIIDGARRHNATILPAYAAILRDIVGNPFRPSVVLPRDLGTVLDHGTDRYQQRDVVLQGWLTADVLALAQAVYEQRGRKERMKCPECDGEGRVNQNRSGYTICPLCDGHRFAIRTIDGTLDPARLAVLSDALEEAGCAGELCLECKGKGGSWLCPNCRGEWRGDVGPNCFVCSHPKLRRMTCEDCSGAGSFPHPPLAHLRSPGPHVRGCWAVDLILGKN